MSKELKWLYETEVSKEIEEIVTDKQVIDGKTVTTDSPMKKVVKVKVAIQQPNRKLYKGAELFYSKTLAEYLRNGLMPYTLVAKRYANDSGVLTDAEIKRLVELKDELKILEKDFFATIASSIDDKKDDVEIGKKGDLLLKINSVNAEVSAIQNSYADIFDNTAEMKSRNDTIEWWSLFLIYTDEDNKGYKPLFGEGDPTKQEDYQKKVSKLEEFEDKNNSFYNEVIKMSSYLISFWFSAKTSLTASDFQTMERVYKDSLSDYKVSEIVPPVVEEKVATPELVVKSEPAKGSAADDKPIAKTS
jgi:hypothetical protein